MQNKNPELLLEITELIYEASIEEEQWPNLIDHIDKRIAEQQLNPSETQYIHQAILPHLHRASNISRQVDGLQYEQDTLSLLLDRLPFAILLVDKNYQLAFINQQAEKTLNQTLIFGALQQSIHLFKTQKTSQLYQYIDDVLAPSDTSIVKQHNLILSKQGQVCSLHITSTSHANINTKQPMAVIFITDPQLQSKVSKDALKQSFNLSPAEIKLLQTLLEDQHNLTDAATVLGISKHTARNQMKSILLKTDTQSQHELMKNVLRNPMLFLNEYNQKQVNHPYQNTHAQQYVTKQGNTIEYTIFGSADGTPVLYFHGLIHSAKKFHPFSNYINNNHVRIIAIERPGFGASSKHKNISLTTFAQDIQELTNHMKLDSFHILAEGNGCPFGLACASLMNVQTQKVALMSCIPSVDFDQHQGLIPFERQALKLAEIGSKTVLYPFLKLLLKSINTHQKFCRWVLNSAYDADKVIIQTSEFAKIYDDCMDTLTHKSTEAFIEDFFLRTKHWLFPLDTLKAEVHLWHGEHDSYTTLESAKIIASMIPNCTTHFLPKCGHYIFHSHIDQALSNLLDHEPSETVFPIS